MWVMQTKPTRRQHSTFILSRISIPNNICWPRWDIFNGYITNIDVKQCSHLGAHVIGPQMLQHSKWPASIPLYTCLRGKLQTQTHTNSCTYVLTEALFLTYKKWNNSNIHQLSNWQHLVYWYHELIQPLKENGALPYSIPPCTLEQNAT